MVIAHHIILTGYGHWLPNDPRGSMSDTLHAPDLKQLGDIHFGRKGVQPSRDQLRAFYVEAQKHLFYPVLWWNDGERDILGRAFGEAVGSLGLTCYACAILSNHVHLLIRRHRLKAEQVVRELKEAGRRQILSRGAAPVDHPVFSADACHIFKSSVEAVRACVAYIEANYVKHRLRPVLCPWVARYDNWPLHKRERP